MRSLLAAASLLALAGCQEEMLSNDRMQVAIAHRLVVPVEDVTLSDRTTDSATDTYVVAHVRGVGVYGCTVNGGGLLAMGMMNEPDCQRAPAIRQARD